MFDIIKVLNKMYYYILIIFFFKKKYRMYFCMDKLSYEYFLYYFNVNISLFIYFNDFWYM